jgi:hypothetical protein
MNIDFSVAAGSKPARGSLADSDHKGTIKGAGSGPRSILALKPIYTFSSEVNTGSREEGPSDQNHSDDR